MNNKDEYIEKLNAKINEWDAEIKKLQVKAQGAKADLKIECQNLLATFHRRQEEARTRLEQLKKASIGTWEGLKQDTEETINRVKDAYTNALSKIK